MWPLAGHPAVSYPWSGPYDWSDVRDPPGDLARLDELNLVVAAHEVSWRSHAQDPMIAAWLRDVWDPWMRRWLQLYAACLDAEIPPDSCVARATQELLRIRDAAAAHGVPVPGLDLPPDEDQEVYDQEDMLVSGVGVGGPAWYLESLGRGSAETLAGGFWDSLKSAYRTVSTPVTWVNKKIFTALKPLKPVISVAAGVVATAWGGPAAGALAAKLAGPVIDSSAETGGDPTMLFEHAKKKTDDPKAKRDLEHAKEAVKHTAVAYHLVDTAGAADRGDSEAQQRIAEIERAAAAGDAQAARALDVIRQGRAAGAAGTADESTAS
jgi:hypothetical protein